MVDKKDNSHDAIMSRLVWHIVIELSIMATQLKTELWKDRIGTHDRVTSGHGTVIAQRLG